MKLSPQKLKDLTSLVAERGENMLRERIAVAKKNAQLQKESRKAAAAFKKIPARIKAVIFRYNNKEYSYTEILETMAKESVKWQAVRRFSEIRSEVTEMAMSSANEAEFMDKYKKINPFKYQEN